MITKVTLERALGIEIELTSLTWPTKKNDDRQ